MPQRIEDYALIGDCQTAALVGRDGSIDWLCLPRFDSPACFASLLGGPQHGHWTIAPRGRPHSVRRAYRDGSLILDTTFETDEGAVTLTDFMPIRAEAPHVVRVVRGQRGRTPMHTQAAFRFDYGSVVPWVRKAGKSAVHAIAGPDSLRLQSEIPLRGENMTTVADFDVVEGQTRSFVLTWHPSHAGEPLPNLEAMGVAMQLQGRVGRRRALLARYTQSPYRLHDGRNGRRPYHVAPRRARGRAQLGLSLLLGA